MNCIILAKASNPYSPGITRKHQIESVLPQKKQKLTCNPTPSQVMYSSAQDLLKIGW